MNKDKATIVLIHGLWMPARSWEHWTERYTANGYRVIAKSWPGMERDIDELCSDPAPIATLGITEIVNHYQGIVEELESALFIMGTCSVA